ncbi:hypothetical protein DBB31_11450 [Burkholderia multivorans]|nr:hypothetical protein DBB31_11450 [Burkholderia multivorans]
MHGGSLLQPGRGVGRYCLPLIVCGQFPAVQCESARDSCANAIKPACASLIPARRRPRPARTGRSPCSTSTPRDAGRCRPYAR